MLRGHHGRPARLVRLLVSDLTAETARAGTDTGAPVLARLSTLDRFLPVWIVAAMAVGIALGRALPGLDDALDAVQVGSVSLPIAVGLLLMMYPVLAKVRYGELGTVTGDRRLLIASLVLNWLVGPALMFALAWLLLPDLPAYRTGLIIVGLARCIAMVLIWNDLSCGDREAGAVLVAINSVFQIVAFAALGYFYLQLLPGWIGLSKTALDVSVWDIAKSVLVFLGIPLLAGFLTRTLGERTRGRNWYEQRFLPRIGPVALYGLLFTIVVLFALQGATITREPLAVVRIALPLLAYFLLMFGGSFLLGRRLGLGYPKTATLAFTAAGNNFELAIAVAIGVFGVTSGQPSPASSARSSRSPFSLPWSTSPCGPAAGSSRPADRHGRAGGTDAVWQPPACPLRAGPAGHRRGPRPDRGRPDRALLRRVLTADRHPVIEDSYARLAATARVTTHMSNLTGRFAADRLAATAHTQGVFVSEIPEILFVCVHNAGRSQMAAALLNHAAAGRVHVRSAGSTPADQINPAVVRAMDELGLDISHEFPKPLTDDVVQAADVVITMGCGDACPIYPGKRYLDWTLDDPAGQPLDVVRGIRDQIDQRVQGLLRELTD